MDGSLRIGVVDAVNKADYTVRVHFTAENMTSGWLKVVRTPPIISPDGGENKTDEKSLSCDVDLTHYHNLNVIPWFPSVGDLVLCIYKSGFNEDGFVIGAL